MFDARAYLDRIGYAGPAEPTAETLAALHRAHMQTVPFENLDIHLGLRNVLDADHVFDKIVRRRRGGWCFELNGLFALLLEHLGFRVTRCAAGVVLGDEPPLPDFAHLTLRVDIDERWIADVGFGDSFTEPLRLDEPGDQHRGGKAYRLERADGRVTLLQEGSPQYVFTLTPRRMAEFQGMCDALQRPPGHFTDAPICSRLTGDGRVSLAGMRLITTTPAGRVERELADEAERAAVLRETFGVDLGGAPLTGPRHPVGHLFAGIAVADLAAEIDWFSRLFGRPPDILPNADEAMWGATGSGSVYLVRRPDRAGHAHLTLAVDDVDLWASDLAARGIEAVRVETVPAGRKLVLTDPEGNEIGLAGIPARDD